MSQASTHEHSELRRVWQQLQAGRLTEARLGCEALLRRRPEDPGARHAMAVVSLETGAAAEGVAALRALLAERPDDLQIGLDLARGLLHAGELAEAERELRALTARQPRPPEPAMELSALLAKTERQEEALKLLEATRKRVPRHPGLLVNLGGMLAEAGRFEEARGHLERAVALQPNLAVAHYNLGKVLRLLDLAETALSHYRRATEIDPAAPRGWLNLGNLLLDLGRVEEAFTVFRTGAKSRRGCGTPTASHPTNSQTSASKLIHDAEQLEYLAAAGRLPRDLEGLSDRYRAALSHLETPQGLSHVADIPAEDRAALAPAYNKLLIWDPPAAMASSPINPALPTAEIERNYFATGPGITHIDDFLTPEALSLLRRFCLDSTIWFEFRYANGYLGAMMDDGFAAPLLYQISEHLRLGLPKIFRHHSLRTLWAFKYDSRLSGIPIHADFAAVNVNFWITPDEANLEPESGGLEVWDVEAPADWDFKRYNSNEPAIRRFLVDSGAKAVKVPHRQNRAVIFNSDLFHETGPLHFREGYAERRINITMLFGKRHDD